MAEANVEEATYYKYLQEWCDAVAGLVADALIDGKVITANANAQAKEIVSEEILTRLLIGDYPPPINAAPHLALNPDVTHGEPQPPNS